MNVAPHSSSPSFSLLQIIVVPLLLIVLADCNHEEKRSVALPSERKARESESWIKEAIIARLELVPSNKGKTFQRIRQKVSQLKKLGFTVLWLSPIFPVSSLYQEHHPNDPFPVQDYYNTEDDFGTLEEFKVLVQAAHQEGLKIVIDFVAKYTAWDSKLVMDHPDWFLKNDAGGIVSPNSEWSDVAALNYDHHELRKYMVEVMKFWIRDIGIDGFACQNAELVPTDFWERARKEIEKIRPVFMIAQSNFPEHHLEAFDASYWNDTGNAAAENGTDSLLIPSPKKSLKWETTQFPKSSLRLRLTAQASNYPQLRDNSSNTREKLNTVLAYALPGIPVKIFDQKWVQAESVLAKADQDLLQSLSLLRKKFLESLQGQFSEVTLSDQKALFAFERKSPKEKMLVILNYTNTPHNVTIQLPTKFSGNILDFLSSKQLSTKSGQLQLKLQPFDAKIVIRTS